MYRTASQSEAMFYASLAFGPTESLDLEREYLISALIYGDLDANCLCGLQTGGEH